MILNINNNEVMHHTNRLRELHKSALPVAIRETLNSAAFDVKKNTMPLSAKKSFIERQPTFFKANSKVDKATGFNTNTMKSTVGFFSNNLKGSNNYAVEDLEEQENSGRIGGKSFIPLNEARSGKSYNKLVKPNARLSNIRQRLVNRSDVKAKGWGQAMIKSALHVGVGGHILTESSGKGGAVFRVNSIKRVKGNIVFKSSKLYSFNKNRKITVKGTHFMKSASLQSANKMDNYFKLEAEKQIKRLGAK